MKRILTGILLLAPFFGVFAQPSSDVYSIRNYVGLISVEDHPDIIAFVDRMKAELQETDEEDNGKNITPKEAPYERPAGSGFLFKADDGNTYVLTNWHVISFSWNYSISFEISHNEKIVYSGLTLLAADEDTDLALLAFPPGNSPDIDGLMLSERPGQEGEEVYSAGFPALGRDPVWQLGRGQISNSQVMLHKYYDEDDDETMEGPFIQHTSQVDPGNSGGPLLITDTSAPSGFSVVGINAKSARRRQAANYSIPGNTVKSFVENVLNPVHVEEETEQTNLNERIKVFIRGINQNNFLFYDWITYQCFLDNFEFAFYWSSVKYSFSRNFGNRPMGSLGRAFNNLTRESIPPTNGEKKNEIHLKSAEKDQNANSYTVIFEMRGKTIQSRWEIEHGVWRISSLGQLDGDKNKITKAEKLYYNQLKIRDGYTNEGSYMAEAGYALVLNRGNAVYGALGISVGGIRCIFADSDYWQLELFGRGFFKPIRFSVFALEPNVGFALGIKGLPKVNGNDSGIRFGVSPHAGIQLTGSTIPGLYIGTHYQYNLYIRKSNDNKNTRHVFVFMAGYRFK